MFYTVYTFKNKLSNRQELNNIDEVNEYLAEKQEFRYIVVAHKLVNNILESRNFIVTNDGAGFYYKLPATEYINELLK